MGKDSAVKSGTAEWGGGGGAGGTCSPPPPPHPNIEALMVPPISKLLRGRCVWAAKVFDG